MQEVGLDRSISALGQTSRVHVMTVDLSQPANFLLLALSFASGLLVTDLALSWMTGRRK
jgi:hypothetical protein